MISKTLKDMRDFVSAAEGAVNLLQQQLEAEQAKLTANQEKLQDIEEAYTVVAEVAASTQEQLEYKISELASLALATIFPDPYKVKLNFSPQRGKSTATFTLLRDGKEIDPMDAAGGGVVDIVAFALRVSLWNLKQPPTAPIIILDEPFRFVSMNLQPVASTLLKEICSRLKLQIIMVTHSEALIEAADNAIRLNFVGGRSNVSSVTPPKTPGPDPSEQSWCVLGTSTTMEKPVRSRRTR